MADRVPHPPDQIGQPECDEKPGREFTARRLPKLQLRHRQSERDAQAAKQHGAEHVPQPAEQGDPNRLGAGPPQRPAHGHEGEIVVRADQGM